MRRIIFKLLCFFPIIIFIVIVNILVDPARLFKTSKYEQKIATFLLNGLNVGSPGDFDERIMQKYYIEGLKEKKDIIVLGSSRSSQIRAHIFPDKRFFCNFVSGASLEDYLAIFQIYIENDKKPDTVILGLDPWILNSNNGQGRWKSIGRYYKKMSQEIIPHKKSIVMGFPKMSAELGSRYEKYLNAVSFAYFQESLTKLHSLLTNIGKENNTASFSTNSLLGEKVIRLSDGGVSYGRETIRRSVSDVLVDARKFTQAKSVYSLGRYYKVNKELLNELEMFIEYLQRSDIKVVLFLPPYHPYVYDYLINSDEYGVIGDVQLSFNKLAEKFDILILGSYNPIDMGFSDKDFFDGQHHKEKASIRYWSINLKRLCNKGVI